MRRKRQQLDEGTCRSILERMTSGVLALRGEGGYPYAVPLSYVLCGEHIYFHSAPAGHKVDAIRGDARASFCVVERDEVKAEEFTTYFRSVIVFGKVRLVEDEDEKMAAIRALAAKYSPEEETGREREIGKEFPHLLMIDMNIEHLSGKEAIELVRKRGG